MEEHLTYSEISDFCKKYRDGGIFDDDNNIKEDVKALCERVNNHIAKCSVCKKRVSHLKNELVDNKLNKDIMDTDENTDENTDKNNALEILEFDESPEKETIDEVSPFEITDEMVNHYMENPDELESSNYTPAQKEAILRAIRRKRDNGRQLVLATNNKKNGYADALILALVTGFAGGIFLSVLLMLCR